MLTGVQRFLIYFLIYFLIRLIRYLMSDKHTNTILYRNDDFNFVIISIRGYPDK